MKPNTHYTPTENGFSISGSAEVFNRTLYGSHKNDTGHARYCTFAGDAPQFMGRSLIGRRIHIVFMRNAEHLPVDWR